MECGEAEADSNDVEKLACFWPPLRAKVLLPRRVVPSKKVTKPVGPIKGFEVTVAVKVTVSPTVIVGVWVVTAVVVPTGGGAGIGVGRCALATVRAKATKIN